MDKYSNPFQAIDVDIPSVFHDHFQRYCQSVGSKTIDQSPFPRMIDMWFLALCLGVKLGLEPIEVSKQETTKIIDGSIFSSDPWRIQLLMIIAIAQTGDVHVVSEPRRVMSIANGLVIAALPNLLEMLKNGRAEPIWNLSESLDELLTNSNLSN